MKKHTQKPMPLNHEYGVITMRKVVICPGCLNIGSLETRFWAINPDRQEVIGCPCGTKFVIKHGKGLTKEARNE